MNKFQITILDQMFGELTGMFIAEDRNKAIKEAITFYAHELGTYETEIEILNVVEA